MHLVTAGSGYVLAWARGSESGGGRNIPAHAGGMTLRLFRLGRDGLSHKTEKSLDLTLHPCVHKTGDVWHIQVDNLRNLRSMVYAWEAIGPLGWRGQLRFAPGAPLLDPYANQARRVKLPESEAGGREIWAGAPDWLGGAFASLRALMHHPSQPVKR